MDYEAEERITNNLRHLVRFEAKPYPRELPETSVTRAFGARAPPKLVGQLQSPELVIRQKALLAAVELLKVPECYSQCLEGGVLAALTELLLDADELVRQRAAAAVQLVASKLVGCERILRHRTLPPLVGLLGDASPSVRQASYSALIEAARFDCICHALAGMPAILPRLLELTLEEEPSRSVLGLQLLTACAAARNNDEGLDQLILVADIIHSMKPLLAPEQPLEVVERATTLLSRLCMRQDARLKAVAAGHVERLVQLLQRGSLNLSIAAASALAAITVAIEGKDATVQCPGGCQALVSLLDVDNEVLQHNLLAATTNVAESPAGRKALQEARAVLGQIKQSTARLEVSNGASQALRQLDFSARPYQKLPVTPRKAQQAIAA
ncbi:hypothetical protein WJX72_000167 [[Myrmecia] bisecta]|uniref:Radial spoke protein 8 n=1 Tax=[Myrmecia] bisecta TaxID=41462 RepID=A0AAW1R4Q5_9CHLO